VKWVAGQVAAAGARLVFLNGAREPVGEPVELTDGRAVLKEARLRAALVGGAVAAVVYLPGGGG